MDNKNLNKAIELGTYFKNILKANDWAMVIDLNNCSTPICSNYGLGTDYYKN